MANGSDDDGGAFAMPAATATSLASITINYTSTSTTFTASLYQEIYVNLQIVKGDLLNFSERFVMDPNESASASGAAAASSLTVSPSSMMAVPTAGTDGDCTKICLSWEKMFLVVLFCALIVITVIGNTLVILSVATTRRLRTVTNCFVMSLAVADWLVGIFVMPPAVIVFVVG